MGQHEQPILIQLATYAETFAPLFTDQNKSDWNTLCNLIASEISTSLNIPINDVRAFVLNPDTGDNAATTWPVVAQNDNPNIKAAENPITRPELLNAGSQTLSDYQSGTIGAWVGYRISTSTDSLNYYGTSQIVDIQGTTDYVLKLAVAV